MAQSSTADLIIEKFNIDERYKSSIKDDIEKLYISSSFSDNLSDISDMLGLLCAEPRIIKSRGDLCALTNSVIELKELNNSIKELGIVASFPSPRSTCYDKEELLGKLQFAKEYDFPYVNENNIILLEFFDPNDTETNYMKPYYLSETLYTPEEKKTDRKFRSVPDIEKYYRFVAKTQKLSFECFGKVLKLNSNFNDFVLYQLQNADEAYSYEEIITNGIEYLKTDENPFLDSERLFSYLTVDSIEESDRGVRR